MGLDDLVHDAIPVNQPYAGLGAEAYDVWMPPSGDDPDVEVYRRSIERGAGPRHYRAATAPRLDEGRHEAVKLTN